MNFSELFLFSWSKAAEPKLIKIFFFLIVGLLKSFKKVSMIVGEGILRYILKKTADGEIFDLLINPKV